MPWFKQKPMLVEAIRYDGTNDAECSAFAGETVVGSTKTSTPTAALTPNFGDWIYRDSSGVVAIASDELFKRDFETV